MKLCGMSRNRTCSSLIEVHVQMYTCIYRMHANRRKLQAEFYHCCLLVGQNKTGFISYSNCIQNGSVYSVNLVS